MAKLRRPKGQVKEDHGGFRKNTDKPAFELIPPEALWALAHHYAVGARKYAIRNWERGMSMMWCYGCIMRHLIKWALGNEYDKETGSHHMICVMWNAAAIYTYAVRQIGEDDRHVPTSMAKSEKEAGKFPWWIEPGDPKLKLRSPRKRCHKTSKK